MDLSLVPYQHTSKSETPLHQDGDTHNNSFNLVTVKYRECMKNHAASIGGHANDGCGEFMPPADHGLTCAACGCHRNFHRREGSAGVAHLLLPPPQQHPLFFYNAGGSSTSVLMKHLTHDCVDNDDDDHDRRSETPDRGEVNFGLGGRAAAKNKRFRTKFTQEQKDKMLEFAETIGWRINKHDDMALNQFCNEVGVKRNVLKVWMHNNKNAHRRRESTSPSSAVAGAPTPPPAPPQPVEV